MSEQTSFATAKQLREELNEINASLRAHNTTGPKLGDKYMPLLRRSIEIMGTLNMTTAGPKTKSKKAVRQVTTSLDDL